MAKVAKKQVTPTRKNARRFGVSHYNFDQAKPERTERRRIDQMENPKGPIPEEVIAKIREESPEDADVAQKLLDWSRQHFTKVPTTSGGWLIVPEFGEGADPFRPFGIQKETSRALYIYVKNIKRTPPFDTAGKWEEFRDRLVLRGFKPTPEHDYYKAKYSDLANDEALKAFQETIAWSIEQVKRAYQ